MRLIDADKIPFDLSPGCDCISLDNCDSCRFYVCSRCDVDEIETINSFTLECFLKTLYGGFMVSVSVNEGGAFREIARGVSDSILDDIPSEYWDNFVFGITVVGGMIVVCV